jgi:hypothetical protein
MNNALLEALSMMAGEVTSRYDRNFECGHWLVFVTVDGQTITGQDNDLDQAVSQVIERVKNTVKEAA